jgi:hypothetical protein
MEGAERPLLAALRTVRQNWPVRSMGLLTARSRDEHHAFSLLSPDRIRRSHAAMCGPGEGMRIGMLVFAALDVARI